MNTIKFVSGYPTKKTLELLLSDFPGARVGSLYSTGLKRITVTSRLDSISDLTGRLISEGIGVKEVISAKGVHNGYVELSPH